MSIFGVGRDGSDFTLLRTFTDAAGDGFTPVGPLREGLDGALYGILYRGSDYWDRDLFRMDKDGGNFRIILSRAGIRDLVPGSDGHLYGLTFWEKGAEMGALFRIGPALKVQKTTQSIMVQMTGIPGTAYELQRSTDLTHWNTVRTFVMPDNLLETYEEPNPEQISFFYRLATPSGQ